MHLLYLDDSGSAKNQKEDYFVLGGLSVFEAQAHYIIQELEKLASTIDAQSPNSIEFHASEIRARRRPPWKSMSLSEANGIIKAVLNVLRESYDTSRAFACAIHKSSFPSLDLVETAFEDLCSRFDHFLSRLRDSGDRQRGLIILDNSSYETSLQSLSNTFRRFGTRWHTIKNLADIPFFADSKASRIIQLADHVAYAVFRRYNSQDTQFFDIIASKFDTADGVIHGLCHKQNYDINCTCPACLSRRCTHN